MPWNEAPRYLVRDRDQIYGEVVRRRLRAMSIRYRLIAGMSSWLNGVGESDRIHPARVQRPYHRSWQGAPAAEMLRSIYHNAARTHRSLNKDAPVSRPHFR